MTFGRVAGTVVLTRRADTVPGARLVELAACRHDAPLSHPSLFAHAMVDPLLEGLRER